MSSPASPSAPAVPERANTVRSSSMTTATRQTSLSDEEAIPDSDSNETTNLLVERLRALKHMCGYLEDYVNTTAKMQKSQAKEYEKILKTVSNPLREAHHFSQSSGGISAMFESIRANTQGMMNMCLDTEKNLKGSVSPILERVHKEIKAKTKEVHNSASKTAKAVDKARAVTQKHIDLLSQQVILFDAAAGNKIEQHYDPYVLRRGINHRLNKQIIEENNNRQDVLALQNNFQQFETHIVQTIQSAVEQFFQFTGGQLERQRHMYADILGSAQRVPPDFEWVNFVTRNDTVLVDPDSPPRSLANVSFLHQDHRATQPLKCGSLDRKSRAVIRGYSSGYYVVTPARYLHEFKDDDDLRRDPVPELSLYLPDCVIGAIDGVKFSVKGKDVSGGKVGNAFHTNTELSFKAHSSSDAENWWSVIKDASRGEAASAPAPAQAVMTAPVVAAAPGQAAPVAAAIPAQAATPAPAQAAMTAPVVAAAPGQAAPVAAAIPAQAATPAKAAEASTTPLPESTSATPAVEHPPAYSEGAGTVVAAEKGGEGGNAVGSTTGEAVATAAANAEKE